MPRLPGFEAHYSRFAEATQHERRQEATQLLVPRHEPPARPRRGPLGLPHRQLLPCSCAGSCPVAITSSGCLSSLIPPSGLRPQASGRQGRWLAQAARRPGGDGATSGIVSAARQSSARSGRKDFGPSPESGEAPVLVVLCGPSHLGDTTFAKQLGEPSRVITSDAVRERLRGRSGPSGREDEVCGTFEAMKLKALEEGRSVVPDARPRCP